MKKAIKEDPRYTKFSTSDKKCEKEFGAWLKDRVTGARGAYRQLLQETRLITDKSLQMIKDKEGNHMEEIEEVLCKDSRSVFALEFGPVATLIPFLLTYLSARRVPAFLTAFLYYVPVFPSLLFLHVPAPVTHCVPRYHVMEPLNDDRADILMSYLEELERRGPPPPPTASEPGRRK